MVKELVSTEKSSFVNNQDKNNPQGCMWSLLNILDYHHWHVRKVFANKKKRHARYKRNTILHNQGEEYGSPEAEKLLVAQGGDEKGKRYQKHEQKEQDREIRLKEGNYKGEYALHVEKDGKKTQERPNKPDRDSANVFKNHGDVLGVVRVEKDLLLKFLRELDSEGKNLHQASHPEARLTKSGSFPLTSSSQMRSITPSSSLEHKKTEVWATPKGERLLDSTQTIKPVPLASDHAAVSARKQKPADGLNHKGWNEMVLHRFRVIKQKIKHTLLELRKNGHQRDSSEYNSITNDVKEALQSLDDGVVREYIRSKSLKETKSSDSDYASNRQEAQRLVRRTTSLNESMDKYTRLFEKSFNDSDVKWHSSKSKSLRLTSEDKMISDHASRFSRSNLSLPNIEALSFIVHEALVDMKDKTGTDEPDNGVERKLVALPSKKDKSIDHVEETEITETAKDASGDMNPSPLSNDQVVDKIEEAVTSEKVEDTYEHEPARGDGIFPQEKEEIGMAIVETNSDADATHHTEGRELDIQGSSMDELKTESPSKESIYSSPSSLPNANDSTENVTNKSPENIFQDIDNDSNFRYVKAILQFSGFMENDQILTRHTIDQRLKPSLIMEMESSIEDNTKANDQQLLFNLVDEVLLDIYDRSSNHFPRPFAFNYRLHPVPKGHYLLNEVWSSVKSYLSLRPELDQTLDDVVRCDLARRSSWMNLQQEEEQVAIELEDMILDDLLDELVFS
ncbi:hypothetical protein PIB30_023034 [Stylosanthes scabra]|uniref:DUF4378 domain-containing protein n=1 Tax=Stylosanthes scabra TaxID=79078 RepID=A0ABU6WCD6_9FABA|nr:hypothetical protein [Stylosanthes scabra]